MWNRRYLSVIRGVAWMINRVDLVMWTKNGAETLPLVLKRISEVMPNKFINKRIIVDDGSTDNISEIARDFG